MVEYGEAVDFYEERAAGLGREFYDEVERVLRLVGANAALGSPFEDEYRRAYCRRFPFAVVYTERDDHVLVLAVMHQRRRPGYWKSRV